MRRTAGLLLGLALIWPLAWAGGEARGAETYPAYADLFVNDFADVLSPAAEDKLRAEAEALRAETGVEMTIVTIPSRAAYGDSPSIERFASGLFNDWGVGRAEFNDGIMILAAIEDREMRIELGAGYDQGYDTLAQDIINRWLRPEFSNGAYEAGLTLGARETANRIARRHSEGLEPEPLPFRLGDWLGNAIPALFVAGIGALILIRAFGRHIGDWTYRFRSCPTCGQRGLHQEHLLPESASTTTGRIVTTCRHCDWRNERDWVRATAQRRSGGGSGGGSFGGGRSSGGGASGRW